MKKKWKLIKYASFLLVFVISITFGVYVTMLREGGANSTAIQTIETIQKVVIFTDIALLLLFAFARSKD